MYLERPPSPALAPWVECFWELKTGPAPAGPAERVIPDGCPEIILHLSGTASTPDGERRPDAAIVGQLSGPLLLVMGGSPHLFGIRLRPWALPGLTGLPASAFTDRAIALDAVFGGGATALMETVHMAGDFAKRCQGAEAWIAGRRLRPDPTGFSRLLAGPVGGDAGDLVKRSGWSRRTLERRFQDQLGVSPKMLLRVTRLQRTLDLVRADPLVSLAEMAAAGGFTDQAHFTHEFARLAGITPAAWRRANGAFDPLYDLDRDAFWRDDGISGNPA